LCLILFPALPQAAAQK